MIGIIGLGSTAMDRKSERRPAKAGSRFRRCVAGLLAGVMTFAIAAPASANVRIKDIADFEGVRDNILIGYGLVVGLNGTGDDLSGSVFTRESLIGMLERLGVNARSNNLSADNVAAVMVTATLPPFARQGTRIDIAVSAIGNADSLEGGSLLVTPMLGADGNVYAVAQGTLSVSGFEAQGDAESITKGVPTNARIPNGAIIEREVDFNLAGLRSVRVALRNPDFTTARRVARAVNSFLGAPAAVPLDPATIQVNVPQAYNNNAVALMTDIELLRVVPDQVAKVVVDEQSGVIVMGENVRISEVAISQGNLTIRITETPQVSQPQPFAPDSATTEVVPRTSIDVEESGVKKLTIVPSGVTLQELVEGLNALGVGPRDMMSILQTIKAAGALQAELEFI